MHPDLRLPTRADIKCYTWGEGPTHEKLAERPSLEAPSGIETHLDKSLWLLAIRSLLPSDLMAKRSTGHMFAPFGEKYTEPTKQALHLWVLLFFFKSN